MLKVQVQSYALPRWVVPVVFLAALALIPFALMLALGLGALALGASVVLSLLPPAKPAQDPRHFGEKGHSMKGPDSPQVIDADYEVKDENAKSE